MFSRCDPSTSGLEDIDNWKDTDRDSAISLPAFLEKSHRADKYVIAGHWPVINYPSNVPAHNPFIDHNKKIIAIDGGNTIKTSGQLNAFIIQRTSSEDLFSYTYVDHLPSCKVLEDFQANPVMTGSITYPHFDVNPVEKGDNFTLCKQPQTNRLLYVKNEYLKQNETGSCTVTTDLSCTQLSVKKGDIVSIADDSCEGYTMIKKDGAVGWVMKEVLRKSS
ncbi:hypothetical protein J9303_13340 [Bacillaceae bacterium Marseille-Q3522]|nr:hypothetical protein [Bacillaceae bacterium Marseille-Q3522]